MSILDRYLLMSLLRGGTPVFLLLLGLFGFFELAQQLNDVGKGSFESIDALRVTGFSLPRIAIDVLPVTCLLGCITGMGGLASQQEITMMRVSGMSVMRISRPLIWLVGVIVVVALGLQQFVIPEFERQASTLRAQAFRTGAQANGEFWTRSESILMRVGGVDFGRMPKDIEIYELDDKGLVTRLIQAKEADVLAATDWVLHGVTTTQFAGEVVSVERTDRELWISDLSPDQIFDLIVADYALAPLDLYRYIDHLRDNELDAHRYSVLLWQQLSLPVGLIAMALLGVPFIIGSFRLIPMGTRVTMGSMIGVFFYLSQRTLVQVGLLYGLPGALTGLLPVVVTLLIALVAIQRVK